MLLEIINPKSKRKATEALLLPFFEGTKLACTAKALLPFIKEPLESGDFKGKKEELLCYYGGKKSQEKRIILVGLGSEKEVSAETVRRSFALALKFLKNKVEKIAVHVPEVVGLSPAAVLKATSEGILLANDVFDLTKSKKEKQIKEATFLYAANKGEEGKRLLKRVQTVCSSVSFARMLVMKNADEVTPSFLQQKAEELKKQFPFLKVDSLNGKEIQKQKLGLLTAVARGSKEEPRLILIEYRGKAKAKEKIALIGKGITYDTGGLNLKPASNMESMRTDMAGAAAVLGVMRAAAELKLEVNLIGVICAAENAIGSGAYKTGDVYTGYDGTTVEVVNPDAEGRLVLADGLSYCIEKHRPTQIIDIATLTGGALIALGEEASAVLSNDEALVKALIEAGERTYERLWRLPLYGEYKDLLKSKVADMKNSGERKATCIQGGIFLSHFVKQIPWAHIDIAGTAFPDKLKAYHPFQATGVGVRLILDFLEAKA